MGVQMLPGCKHDLIHAGQCPPTAEWADEDGDVLVFSNRKSNASCESWRTVQPNDVWRPMPDRDPRPTRQWFELAQESHNQWAERVTREVFGELQQCSTCRFSKPDRHDLFLCRFNPPQIGPRGAEWPVVDGAQWCGRWEVKRA